MSNIEIKKCPFCGGKAEINFKEDYSTHRFYWVECCKCDARTSDFEDAPGKEEAVSSWNRRAPSTEEARLLEEIGKRIFSAVVYNKDFNGREINNLLCFGDVAEIIVDLFEEGK